MDCLWFPRKVSAEFKFLVLFHCLLTIITVQPFNKALRRAPVIHLEFSELNGDFVILRSNSPQELWSRDIFKIFPDPKP